MLWKADDYALHIAVNNLVITGRCGIKFLSDDAFDAKVTSLFLLDVKLYDGIVYNLGLAKFFGVKSAIHQVELWAKR